MKVNLTHPEYMYIYILYFSVFSEIVKSAYLVMILISLITFIIIINYFRSDDYEIDITKMSVFTGQEATLSALELTR